MRREGREVLTVKHGRFVERWLFGYKAICAACRRPHSGPERALCRPCRALVPGILPPQCPRCGRPLLRARPVCAGCFAQPPVYTRGFPAGVYAGALQEWLNALKFGGRVELAEPLGALLAARTGRLSVDAIVPVPLSPSRLAERGYNQSLLLAQAVADRLRAPCRPDWLERARTTMPQTRLTPAERRQNVRGAFRAPHPARLGGRSIGLVDDVLTTGSTLNAAALCLRAAGAREVIGLYAAITLWEPGLG